EIINFLVLVWILKRFLYKPIMETIARRRGAIEKTLSDAKAMREEAQALKGQFENRLGAWEREKEKARTALLEEIKAERGRLMAELQASLDQEREKNRVLEERRMDELRRAIETEAAAKGSRFAARLLSRLATPELEAKIIAIVTEDLARLPEEKRETIRRACLEGGSRVKTVSAFPLGDAQRNALVRAMSDLARQEVSLDLSRDQGLIAGIRISVGPWVLGANLKDEMESFAEAAKGARSNGS
ncbi:MAG TPA: F0F1 ATP synthase subunit delta, partial [Nitrospiria bacterium]|nr:F0F1 ATP synthase subunit delta [Nitrospiria bacterium]